MELNVGVGLTNACDLACAHYYRDTERIDQLTADELIGIGDDLPVRSINLGTGENGLHRDYESIVAALVRKEGREITYVIVTNGNKGSGDRTIAPQRLSGIREEEQRNAARALGVERVEFLGYEDGEVEDTRQLRLDIARQIRRWRPHRIITQNPARTYQNFHAWHRDHRVTGGVVLDCVYPSPATICPSRNSCPSTSPTRARGVPDPVGGSSTGRRHHGHDGPESQGHRLPCEPGRRLHGDRGPGAYACAEGFNHIVLPG